jgi:hypothetical protein
VKPLSDTKYPLLMTTLPRMKGYFFIRKDIKERTMYHVGYSDDEHSISLHEKQMATYQ